LIAAMRGQTQMAATLLVVAAGLTLAAAQRGARQPPATRAAAIEVLKPVAALPAHLAGTFQDITACHQSADGDYFVFDRRAHSVYVVPPGLDSVRKLIEIGTEPGRLLDPTAFDLAADGTFAVADAPHRAPRVQRFLTSGSSLNGFYLEGKAVSRIVLGNLVLSGIAALEYTGTSLFISQPERGALVTEYGVDGTGIRSFGELRRTGQEGTPDVHLALNTGLVVANPAGGFYFVFLAGIPQFRKYDAAGTLLFERHVEGAELDPFLQSLPTTWKRRKTEDGEMPLVLPSVYAAGADRHGNLWISLAVGSTYVYGPDGDRRRIVQFRAAGGPLLPTGLSFLREGRVLVTPGCYAFPT
jgi:hypothetical protein